MAHAQPNLDDDLEIDNLLSGRSDEELMRLYFPGEGTGDQGQEENQGQDDQGQEDQGQDDQEQESQEQHYHALPQRNHNADDDAENGNPSINENPQEEGTGHYSSLLGDDYNEFQIETPSQSDHIANLFEHPQSFYVGTQTNAVNDKGIPLLNHGPLSGGNDTEEQDRSKDGEQEDDRTKSDGTTSTDASHDSWPLDVGELTDNGASNQGTDTTPAQQQIPDYEKQQLHFENIDMKRPRQPSDAEPHEVNNCLLPLQTPTKRTKHNHGTGQEDDFGQPVSEYREGEVRPGNTSPIPIGNRAEQAPTHSNRPPAPMSWSHPTDARRYPPPSQSQVHDYGLLPPPNMGHFPTVNTESAHSMAQPIEEDNAPYHTYVPDLIRFSGPPINSSHPLPAQKSSYNSQPHFYNKTPPPSLANLQPGETSHATYDNNLHNLLAQHQGHILNPPYNYSIPYQGYVPPQYPMDNDSTSIPAIHAQDMSPSSSHLAQANPNNSQAPAVGTMGTPYLGQNHGTVRPYTSLYPNRHLQRPPTPLPPPGPLLPLPVPHQRQRQQQQHQPPALPPPQNLLLGPCSYDHTTTSSWASSDIHIPAPIASAPSTYNRPAPPPDMGTAERQHRQQHQQYRNAAGAQRLEGPDQALDKANPSPSVSEIEQHFHNAAANEHPPHLMCGMINDDAPDEAACLETFPTRDELIAHQFVKHRWSDRRYVCGWKADGAEAGCVTRYRYIQSLIKHQNRHSGLRDENTVIPCPFNGCNMELARKAMKNHWRRRHRFCWKCDKVREYPKKMELDDHITACGGDPPPLIVQFASIRQRML